MNTFKTTVNGVDMLVNNNLTGYEIYACKSSMVGYIATITKPTCNLYMQFVNGTAVMFNELPKEVIAQAVAANATSIGKFYHAFLKDKFEATKVEANQIALAPEDEQADFMEFDNLPADDFDFDL